jgi:glycerol 3-phosphatase-2
VAKVGWGACDGLLAEGFQILLLDLDGVVYVGQHAVPSAAESLERAKQAGLHCSYVTNNASRPPGVVAEHLRDLGIAAQDSDVVTSAQEGAELLATKVAPGSEVLAVGGPGVTIALSEVGLVPVSRYADGVLGVLQGYGVDVGWRDLAEATYAVTAGVVWVATNPDLTVPTARGTAPGNGQLVAVVQRTTGIDPLVTGKPGPGLFHSAVRRAGGGAAIVVGDRLDTDIAGAVAADLPSLLVLTGVTGPTELLAAGPRERPTYVADDLMGLWHSHPEVSRFEDGWACRSARAFGSDGRLGLSGDAGEDGLDLLRAAAATAWEAADAGTALDLGPAIESLKGAGG